MDVQKRITELTTELNDHAHRYYVLDAPIITDATYDQMFRELRELENNHPELAFPNSPTKRIGGVSTSFKKVRHARRMLSLENVYSAEETVKWFGEGTEVMLHPKIDGASLKLIYVNGELTQAITRGDGIFGEDVTANARTVMTLPLRLLEPVSIEVIGEVYMTFTQFTALNKKLEESGDELFANPRNAAAGSIKLKNSADVSERKLNFVAYGTATDVPAITTQYLLDQYLECLGFQSVAMLPVISCAEVLARLFVLSSVQDVQLLIDGCDRLRETLDLPTDGLVFKINSLEQQRELGDGTRAPKWAAAFKYPPERKPTTLQGIVLQIGKSGKVTPVAELKPVHLSGTVVSRASLCNSDEIARLRIDIGDTVFVEKSAEIIPKVMGVKWDGDLATKKVWQMPDKCPCCGAKLVRPLDFVDWYCPNRDECDEQVFARLKHATGKQALDIDGCGEVMVRSLMEQGVRKLSDVFALKDLSFLKAAARSRFYAGRANAKNNPLWRKLHALNIEGFGRTLCQDVANRFNSIAAIFDELSTFKEMVGEVDYLSFINQVDAEEVERLEQLGLKFETDKTTLGPLSGKSFVITGTLTLSGLTRTDASRLIEEAGGSVKSAVSSNTTFLVVGEGGGAQKRQRAERYKVPTLSEQELFDMMKMPIPKSKAVDPMREY